MMEERIRTVLAEKVNPLLEGHRGGAELAKYENGVAYVKMTGACSGCPSAQYTVEDIIRSIVLEELPELDDIVLDMSVSRELIDMAKKILSGEIKINQ
ncbi:MAG: NifU family protein [Clostridiales Family XIII bacterium]|jgi:Fe-S cluster biogenesis protein NfuA|nr:NifU family protein [Clostridiales Family XIII bacterium]